MFDILSVRAWALESNFFERVAPMVISRVSNGLPLQHLNLVSNQKAYANLNFDESAGLLNFQVGENQRVAIMQIVGGITKYGGLCAYGTRDHGMKLSYINSLSDYIGTVLISDTPGGSVDGTPEFGMMVKNSSKPIVTFVDGMLCSAGYWYGSQSSAIIANKHNYNTIGSIGTLCMLVNQSEALKKEGLKVEIIRAAQSVDKAKLNSIEEASEESIAALKAELFQITEDFISTVKEGRGDRLANDADVFTGKTFGTDEAIANGLIDAKGTLQDAIAKVVELSSMSLINSIL